ncbi:MAG TPA: LacI family DNA-binding transcriptional regulator [Egibacteraceae bacterium]|nr:LacI family DNA-binding transcriptional regulator [Egibacteraceae bacterium]
MREGVSAVPARLRDVAEAAGVSITTVSRILNGRESGVPIREQTRSRVLAAAAELKYRPNLLARGLRGSSSSLLGVIARDISDPFHIQILKGINETVQGRDYRLFLGNADYRPEIAVAYGSMFERSHADGIIVIGDLQGGDAALDQLGQQHRYLIGVTDRTQRRQVPGVYGDSLRGTHLAMEHLWDLGHRSIICVSDNRTDDGRLRATVYEKFMRDHDAPDSAIKSYTTDQEPEPAYQLGRRMFGEFALSPTPPTAIYATSDTTAIGLLRAAFEAGVAVPRQLSIIGFDDIDLAPFTIPPLSTVSQTGIEMGRTAAQMLLDMIDHERDRDDVQDIVIDPELVVRRSTAPPPV